MLSLFPSLLSYSFFALTILRVAAAIAILYSAYHYAAVREVIARTKMPFVRHIPEWLTLVGSLIACVTGILLFVGLYTQGAAIVGMILALKDIVYARRYPQIMPLSSAAASFLFVMCLVLLLSGAGAFAFDLPL